MKKEYEVNVRVRFIVEDENVIPTDIAFEKVIPEDERYNVISWQTDDAVDEVRG